MKARKGRHFSIHCSQRVKGQLQLCVESKTCHSVKRGLRLAQRMVGKIRVVRGCLLMKRSKKKTFPINLNIFFVFSLSSGNTSECFGELNQAVKTRITAGAKCDDYFRFFPTSGLP